MTRLYYRGQIIIRQVIDVALTFVCVPNGSQDFGQIWHGRMWVQLLRPHKLNSESLPHVIAHACALVVVNTRLPLEVADELV